MRVDSTDRELRNARQRGVDRGWAIEKRAVLEGKGSRDWTPEQQKELVEKNSVSHFEGHHMRSVVYGKTREEQIQIAEDGNNIQFLEKSETNNEHLRAHGGDYHNSTNGYYDVKTNKMNDFGDGQPHPPERKELSQPVYKQEHKQETKQEQYDEYGVRLSENGKENTENRTQYQARNRNGN